MLMSLPCTSTKKGFIIIMNQHQQHCYTLKIIRMICLFLILIGFLEKSSYATILTPYQLETSVERCYPQILNAEIDIEINANETKKNKAPFDTNLNANTNQRQGSSYNTQYEKVSVEKRLYGSPISVYSGYDISSGYAPQYEGAQITSTQGREFIGLKLNLLNGFEIDQERVNLYNAMLETERAKYQLNLVKLLVKTDAIKAYINWVLAGLEVKAYEHLVNVAQRRQVALERRLKEGDVARITVRENYNNLLKRRIRLMSAKDNFNQASQNLSLYYRGSQCQVVLPGEKNTPQHLPHYQTIPPLTNEELNAAVQQRPEFKIIGAQMSQLINQEKLAATNLKPKLSASLQYNQNNSDDSTTPNFTINQNEYLAKIDFSFPLEQSYGKGFSNATIGKIQKLKNEQQFLLDQLRSRIHVLSFRIKNTRTQGELSANDLSLSKELYQAEDKRFENGDSSFFMLNLREENVANAYLNMISATMQNYQAFIEFNFLNGQNIDLTQTYQLYN